MKDMNLDVDDTTDKLIEICVNLILAMEDGERFCKEHLMSKIDWAILKYKSKGMRERDD